MNNVLDVNNKEKTFSSATNFNSICSKFCDLKCSNKKMSVVFTVLYFVTFITDIKFYIN